MGPFDNSQGWHNTSTQHVFEERFLLLTRVFKDEKADLSQLLGKNIIDPSAHEWDEVKKDCCRD